MIMELSAGCLLVRSTEVVDRCLGQVRETAASFRAWVAAQTGDPLDVLRRMKFEMIGFHPIQGHPLNVVEQINQTWTYLVALVAARHLLELHPKAGGYLLAPGAHTAMELDIMSEVPSAHVAMDFNFRRPADHDGHHSRSEALFY
jgi:hypothetical protein